MIDNLIYDVGMHDGTDTDFYLKKGFRVLAIEADPALVRSARARFTDALAWGRLTILNLAVADFDGVTAFHRSSAEHHLLSTTVGEIAEEWSTRIGAQFETIEIESRRFETILEEYGVPYYLKVDIEGADGMCIRALEHFARPKYVSAEIPHLHADRHRLYDDLCRLYLLNYRGFKILDQRHHYRIKLPFPAREGAYIAYDFQGHTTGPFGEETPGRWLSFEQIVPVYRPRTSNSRWLHRSKDAWFDLHAKLDAT
jgi:FkbM family methyltransferase